MNTHSTASNEGWIEWNGGECPVGPDTKVEYRLRDGGCGGKVSAAIMAGSTDERDWWSHTQRRPTRYASEDCRGDDIIAYRIVEQGN